MIGMIEIPVGDTVKYEIKNDNELIVDRIIKHKFPANYGFITDTLSQDGDPLDVFVIAPKLHPGAQIRLTILGGLSVEDNGVRDDKIIAVPYGLTASSKGHVLKIKRFLKKYKSNVKILAELNRTQAAVLYRECSMRYTMKQEESLPTPEPICVI